MTKDDVDEMWEDAALRVSVSSACQGDMIRRCGLSARCSVIVAVRIHGMQWYIAPQSRSYTPFDTIHTVFTPLC